MFKFLKTNSIFCLNLTFLLIISFFVFLLFVENKQLTKKQEEKEDKIYNELINIKLKMNKHATTVKVIQNIINSIPESVREKNKEQAFILAEEIVNTSNRYSTITPAKLTAVIFQESRFDIYAESPVGALGLGQIMPTTLAWICDKWKINCDDETAFDPIFNIRATAWYLDWLQKELKQTRLDEDKSLAYYNGGGKQAYYFDLYRKKQNGFTLDSLENIDVNKLAEETRNYVIKVNKYDSTFNERIITKLPQG